MTTGAPQVNWADWTSVESSWVTSSPEMSGKAVFENHDRLFLRDVLGVPGAAYAPNANARWVDNFSHRLSGGWVHMKEVRFGDEMGCAMAAVLNFAPHVCESVPSRWDSDLLCGRPPADRPANVTSGWASIIIEGGYLCAAGSMNQSDIYLLEVPNLLVVRDAMSMSNEEAALPPRRLVGVDPELEARLDGWAFTEWAATHPGRLSIGAADENENTRGAYSTLPQQLWPYVRPSVHADAPPTKGVWRYGQRVDKQAGPPPSLGTGGSSSGGEAPAGGVLLGWVFTETGWANISAATVSNSGPILWSSN